MKSLFTVVEQYELQHEITSVYAYQLKYAVKRFSNYLGRDATDDDLEEMTVNRWLKAERDNGQLSDRSRKNLRTSLLTIWSVSRGDLRRESIRNVVMSPRNPEAWHYDQLEAVAKATDQLTGKLTNGLAKSDYMRTLLWFAYETGLRRRDCWTFDVTRLDENRLAALTQHKTQRVHVVTITEMTCRDLHQLANKLRATNCATWRTPLLWPQSVTTFYSLMRRCRILADVEPFAKNRSLQHIRRTGATEVDADGGRAWRFLGHTREGLDRQAYIDRRKTVQPTTPGRTRSDERARA